ncbi:MAG: hypothetical protein HKN92_07045 [Chitinophagales bacterium]|nr:hypothetical protein [Chitinophagales bacterium]
MKRRAFVSYSLVSGAFLSLFPWKYLSAKSASYELLPMHISQPHIRHGHLYFENFSLQSSCSWLKGIKKDTFLGADYQNTQQDLKHFTIETVDSVIGVGVSDRKVLLNVDGQTHSIEDKIILEDGKTISYYKSVDKGSISIKPGSLLIQIDGNVMLNERVLNGDESVYILKKAMELIYEGNSQFLIINS